MKHLIFVLAIMISLVMTISAQQADLSPLEQRAKDVVEVFNNPTEVEKIFAPSMLSQVPPSQLSAILKKMVADYGKALKVSKLTPQTNYAGHIEISFEKGFVAMGRLRVEEKEPHLISGLLITGVETNSASFEEVISEMKKLSGQSALTVMKLNGNNPEPLASYNADKSFAIGSSFKLYILSELVREINAGERKWSDVVELSESSLPSGEMQDWAKGSPVTLNTLASMMISISDNTATDQLLTTLGREKVEKMLTTAGNSNPNLSIPFLKTVEMFKLKGSTKQNLAEAYLAKDTAGKRAMLAGEIAAFNKEDINEQDSLAKPAYISQIEWFASPNDLAQVMNWLWLSTEKPSANPARGILTINKALPEADANSWKYIGYKGGSETGVISMTYLLQSKKGEWYVVSGSWNDPNASVDNNVFIGMIQKTVSLLQDKTK